MTYHGLVCLHEGVRERELCVLFRNNHFSTLFKLDNQLYLLMTDQVCAATPMDAVHCRDDAPPLSHTHINTHRNTSWIRMDTTRVGGERAEQQLLSGSLAATLTHPVRRCRLCGSQGYQAETHIVWEKFSGLDNDVSFVTGEFQPFQHSAHSAAATAAASQQVWLDDQARQAAQLLSQVLVRLHPCPWAASNG